MTTIVINLTLIEYAALFFVAVILGVTIYFFIRSQRSLRETLRSNQIKGFTPLKSDPTPRKKISPEVEEPVRPRHEHYIPLREELPQVSKKSGDENLVQQMKATIAQQQKMLDSYLRKVEDLEGEGREELVAQNNDLQREISKLHGVIEKKDEEVEELYQEARAAQKMAAKIEEVYQEFDQLQAKMSALEKQASHATNLMIELEDTKQSYEQVHRELARKHDRLEEIMQENHRMRQEIEVLEDKLSEANLQRQQLHKKVQFLQDLNTDMQGISDTNKKLQTELRRIGELESMLHMMAEERDHLLRKKLEK
jgi:chromosome segregation ATPase